MESSMIQVTDYWPYKEDVQFALDQIEQYSEAGAIVKRHGKYAVFRYDAIPKINRSYSYKKWPS